MIKYWLYLYCTVPILFYSFFVIINIIAHLVDKRNLELCEDNKYQHVFCWLFDLSLPHPNFLILTLSPPLISHWEIPPLLHFFQLFTVNCLIPAVMWAFHRVTHTQWLHWIRWQITDYFLLLFQYYEICRLTDSRVVHYFNCVKNVLNKFKSDK